MLLTVFVTFIAVCLCNAVHFYSLRQLAHVFRDFPPPFKRPMLLVSFAIMAIHLVEVTIYGFALWFLAAMEYGSLASIVPIPYHGPSEYFYFAIASYTTLGLGDIVPQGYLRIVVGVESLQGLVLIAWSASFTYLVMEKFWTRGREDILDDF